MNKLVSKNPVQRFKEGKKIIKAFSGASFGGGVRGNNITTSVKIGPLMVNEKWYDNSGAQITPEKIVLQKDRTLAKINGQWYNQNGQLITNFISNKTTPSIKKQPIDNYYLKGFGGNGLKEEIAKEGGVRAIQEKLVKMRLLEGNLKNGTGVDGKWGQNTQDAYNAYKQMTSDLNPTLPTVEEAGIIERNPIKPAVQPQYTPNFGYRTNNTYEDSDFSDRLKSMGIRSNADLIDFGQRTQGNNYDWKGNDWAKQFRSDINQALSGDWSDTNIRKTFNTAGNWGRGFLGSGDISDLQKALQTNAGTWNGAYDKAKADYDLSQRTGSNGIIYSTPRLRELFDRTITNPTQNQVNYEEWAKQFLQSQSPYTYAQFGIKQPGYMPYYDYFKYKKYKKGGLISRNPVKRFKEGSSFGKAFRQARNSGLKEFTWNGKRYTTELKEEKERRENSNNNSVKPYPKMKQDIYNDSVNGNYEKGIRTFYSPSGRKAQIIRRKTYIPN